MRHLDVVIAGYGVAGELHARLLAARPRIRITGIVDVTPQRRALAAHHYPEVLTADRLVNLDAPADLVVVATPPASHELDTRTALTRHHSHVLCEKPAVLNPSEGRSLGEIAATSGLLVHPVHNYRYAHAIRCARRLLADGVIGTVTRVAIAIARPGPSVGHVAWRTRVGAGGGILNDHGPHAFYLTCSLVGQAADTVSCISGFVGADVEQCANIHMTFSTAATADISLSWNATQRRSRYQIHGTEGMLDIDRGTLSVATRLQTRSYPTDDMAIAGHVQSDWAHALHTGFIARIIGHSAAPLRWDEAIYVAELLRAARISARTGGQPIKVAR